MKTISGGVLAMLLTAGVPTALGANTAFTYQGQLKENGVPSNGDFDFRFTLFSSVIPGVIGGPFCVPQVHVVDGLFTAELDFGTAAFGGLPLVMQIDVKPFVLHEIFDCVSNTLPDAFIPLSPMQPLTPAPYAIHALSAPNPSALDAADGSPVNALSVGNTGNVGIGTQTPSAPLHVVEGASGAPVNANASLALERSGNNYLELLAPDANEAGVLFGKPTQGSAAGAIVYDNTATPDGFQFRTNNNSTRMTIDFAGNVGIGSIAPANKLEVVAASNGDGIRLTGSNTNGTKSPGYHLFDETTQRGTLGLAEATDAFSSDAVAGDVVLRANTGKLFLQNGAGASALAISGTNVGIGIPSPTSRLHVNGDIRGTGDIIVTSDFLYTTARTKHFSIPVRALNPNSKDMPWEILPTGAGEYITSSSFGGGVSVELSAPVYLPDGAIVTELRAAIIDDSSNFNITVSLLRSSINVSPPIVMASLSSGGTPGGTNLTDSSISSATIDNGQFCYRVQASWNNSADRDIDLGPVRISYTVAGP